ncbi:MAG: hypothetical protein Unbinned4026contig1002_27 [Prokaryotic dsDNA virus sp.]|nr:MAG: hypothetical protein Unbinned4026contig1002_27 [Prokaryotic dsDNA virus sp.]|tara:strand:+ start:44 stop:430 length:387 start_codon:yes stop_codon:yes gene_type:complete
MKVEFTENQMEFLDSTHHNENYVDEGETKFHSYYERKILDKFFMAYKGFDVGTVRHTKKLYECLLELCSVGDHAQEWVYHDQIELEEINDLIKNLSKAIGLDKPKFTVMPMSSRDEWWAELNQNSEDS